jgi:hypothetical protein
MHGFGKHPYFSTTVIYPMAIITSPRETALRRNKKCGNWIVLGAGLTSTCEAALIPRK